MVKNVFLQCILLIDRHTGLIILGSNDAWLWAEAVGGIESAGLSSLLGGACLYTAPKLRPKRLLSPVHSGTSSRLCSRKPVYESAHESATTQQYDSRDNYPQLSQFTMWAAKRPRVHEYSHEWWWYIIIVKWQALCRRDPLWSNLLSFNRGYYLHPWALVRFDRSIDNQPTGCRFSASDVHGKPSWSDLRP